VGAPGALRWVDGARKDRGDPAGELFDDDLHFYGYNVADPCRLQFFWSFRAFGHVGTAVVGLVSATWAELIYFSSTHFDRG
jgi:hypothetical protein